MIEKLNELKAPKAEIQPCDIRFVTLYLWNGNPMHWTTDNHKTLASAEAAAEWAVPGTLRIFEIPTKEQP